MGFQPIQGSQCSSDKHLGNFFLFFFKGGEWHVAGRRQGKGAVEGKSEMESTITILRLKPANSRKHFCILTP